MHIDGLPDNFEMVSITKIDPRPDHRLALTFSTGETGLFDFKPLLDQGPIFRELEEQHEFERVFLEAGAPCWPNGCAIDPVNVHMTLRDAGALRQSTAA